MKKQKNKTKTQCLASGLVACKKGNLIMLREMVEIRKSEENIFVICPYNAEFIAFAASMNCEPYGNTWRFTVEQEPEVRAKLRELFGEAVTIKEIDMIGGLFKG